MSGAAVGVAVRRAAARPPSAGHGRCRRAAGTERPRDAAALRRGGGSALELLREARNRELPVPFVVITGRGDEAAAVAALKLGAYDYIVKRDGYLTHLPHALDNAIGRAQLARLNQHLQTELTERQRS